MKLMSVEVIKHFTDQLLANNTTVFLLSHYQ